LVSHVSKASREADEHNISTKPGRRHLRKLAGIHDLDFHESPIQGFHIKAITKFVGGYELDVLLLIFALEVPDLLGEGSSQVKAQFFCKTTFQS
jgi:hypothetical protein